MSTYASRTDVENYIEGWTTTDPFGLERTLQRAEQDIDPIVAPVNYELPPTQVISLINVGGGTYTLDLAGNITSALNWNAPASQIQAALQALPNVGLDVNGVSNAQVLGINPYTVVWTYGWVRANYMGQLPTAGVYPENFEVPLLTVNTSGLTPVPGLTMNATVVEVPGRHINPLTDLDRNQVLALSRATCAQVEYRTKMGSSFFVRGQYTKVSGPDFSWEGKLSAIGPKVRRELAQKGLLYSGGRAVAGVSRRGVARGRTNF